MSVGDDVLFGALLAGAGGTMRRRRPRAPVPVRPTPWLAVGAVAVGLQAALLVGALVALGWFAYALASDALLFVLGVIVLPLALTGLTMGVTTIGWMVAAMRRLLAADGSARLDLGVLAAAGLLAGTWLVGFGLHLAGVTLLAPSAAAAVVAGLPDAWRRADSSLA